MTDPYDTDQLERMLGLELHDRADGLGGVPFGFAEVKGRATRIRRTRRVAAAVAVAAAVGIVVPTAMSVGGVLLGQRDVAPAPQPTPGPVEVSRTTLTLDGLERADDPAVEYFTPDGVVLPGVGLQTLEQSYQALVASEADGGWIAVEPDRAAIRYLTDEFEPQGGSAANEGVVTTPDRGWVAFVAPESGAQTLVARSTTDEGLGTTWDLPAEPVAVPVGFVAEDSVVVETVDQRNGSAEVLLAEPDGSLTPLPGVVGAQDASSANGLVSVQTRANEDASGCFGVVDPGTDPSRPLWETCDHSLGAFSPDGRFVLASSPYGSGFGLTSLDVLDARTGDLVARYTQPLADPEDQVTLVQPVWESADTIVTVAQQGTSTTLLRLGADGTLEEVADPVEGDPFADLAYYLGSDRTSL